MDRRLRLAQCMPDLNTIPPRAVTEPFDGGGLRHPFGQARRTAETRDYAQTRAVCLIICKLGHFVCYKLVTAYYVTGPLLTIAL